jgi:hypothetical protein
VLTVFNNSCPLPNYAHDEKGQVDALNRCVLDEVNFINRLFGKDYRKPGRVFVPITYPPIK